MSCNMGSNVYVGLVVLTILIQLIVECSSDRTVSYSNEWIVKTQLSEEGLRLLASRKGFKVPRKIYFVDQLEWKQRSLRAAAPFSVQDAKWNHMWYINRGLIKPTMNVLESWRAGYTGDGVTVAIVDDGVDFHHPDLQPQYEEHLSEDFYDDDTIPLPANGQSHGTKCAGIAVAVKNTVCVIGVAFESRLAVQRVIGPRGANEAGEFRALSKTAGIDIFSNSWGGLDRTTFDGPSPLVARALQQGCSSGRNGKGAIYVFAGGSGGFNDNCNCDGFVNSIYTIAINSVSVDAQPPGYAEPCSAILASTFSGPGGPSDNICTTDVNGGCVEDFQGTSASTPMAAGILALLLQASPELTWRDVQELVVRTSSSRHLKNGRFTTNGVGRSENGNNPFVKVIAVSDWFGYGMLDAQALIQTAQSWQPLPEQHTCSSATGGGTTSIAANVKPRIIEERLTTDGCNHTERCVNSLEHVQVTVTFQSTMRGAVELTLRSPLGTTSQLLTERSGDTANSAIHKWTYTSVQSWGEDPTGEWTLTMAIPSDWRQSGSIRSWQLIMYGTGVGCTYKPCGKTTFVKELLQHHDNRIQPRIQRIVWLYKRWQPLYALIQRIVAPRVQFIQGIPGDLDDDDFFDPTVNNLLVIDDMFSEAGKDTRITGFYTEGSHHRSLSVIGINQNVFGTKDPTQRRNCHYLVLFKNPMDSQAVMLLARQMYPGRSEIFMNAFTKATKQPYKPMLVDLKPFTPENERLRTKALWQDELTNQEQESPPVTIKEGTQHSPVHSSVGVQTSNINAEQDEMSDKMNSCDDCGLLFDTSHDVQRHVKRGWCAEGREPATKKLKSEEGSGESSGPVEDNEAYIQLRKLARKESEDRYNELYDRYVSQGDTEEDASDMAEERIKPYEEKGFFCRYGTLLEKYWLPLRHNAVHQTVLREIQELTDKGVASTSAVKRVLRKVKPKFEDLFEVSGDEQDSGDESVDSDQDDNI